MRTHSAIAAVLFIGLSVGLPVHAQSTPFTSMFLARWNLTHGKYLVDIGQYLEALEAFDTAIETSSNEEVRTEALLQKASVLAIFLDATDDAIRIYDDLLAQYPKSAAAESALFRAGMVLFDRGQYPRATAYFERYLKRYPHGASRASAEFLLQRSRSLVGKEAPPPPAPPSITEVRVRILKGQRSIRIESESALNTTPVVTSGRSIELIAEGGSVSTGTGPSMREVTIAAEHPLHIRAGRTAKHYRGRITVRATAGTLQIVNHVGLEEYLYGVVTKESVASWPAEALKAQAIASRTYALYQAQHEQHRDYDMVDDEGSQVYGGVEGESPPGQRAVDDTRNIVLAYHGRPIYAMFTSNVGWSSADAKCIFDQKLDYLVAQADPYSPDQPMGRWTKTYTAGEIRRAMAAIAEDHKLGPIRAIRPVAAAICPPGRLTRVEIDDDRGSHSMRTRATLGRALNLPEILLDVRQNGEQFTFVGGGFGHGVGLSQWGAKAMADKGHAAKDILAFYYRGAEVTALGR